MLYLHDGLWLSSAGVLIAMPNLERDYEDGSNNLGSSQHVGVGRRPTSWVGVWRIPEAAAKYTTWRLITRRAKFTVVKVSANRTDHREVHGAQRSVNY